MEWTLTLCGVWGSAARLGQRRPRVDVWTRDFFLELERRRRVPRARLEVRSSIASHILARCICGGWRLTRLVNIARSDTDSEFLASLDAPMFGSNPGALGASSESQQQQNTLASTLANASAAGPRGAGADSTSNLVINTNDTGLNESNEGAKDKAQAGKRSFGPSVPGSPVNKCVASFPPKSSLLAVSASVVRGLMRLRICTGPNASYSRRPTRRTVPGLIDSPKLFTRSSKRGCCGLTTTSPDIRG